MAHTLLSDYAVSYASNMTLGSITASMPAAPSSYSGTTGYTHDTKFQLTNETSTRGGGYNFSNGFDSAGNTTIFKGGSNTYNSSNQNTAWSFDGNGNPTSHAGSTLTFDAENHMTAYGSVLTAGYRADGLRAWTTVSAGTSYYLYDGDKPVEELDGSGAKKAVWSGAYDASGKGETRLSLAYLPASSLHFFAALRLSARPSSHFSVPSCLCVISHLKSHAYKKALFLHENASNRGNLGRF